jgi:hypothetical protein
MFKFMQISKEDSKMRIICYTLLLYIFILISTACTESNYVLQNELRTSYQESIRVIEEAHKTRKLSETSETLTEDAISNLRNEIENGEDISGEIEIFDKVTLTDMVISKHEHPVAIIIVDLELRPISYNRNTNEEVYIVGQSRWYTYEVRMVFEDDTWKFDKVIQLIDWGYRESIE